MKIAFLCPFGHVTVIEKPEALNGRVPELIQCTHLHCGKGAAVHEAMVMDISVHATHTFYRPGLGDIISLEERAYCDGGGLMFREIPGAQPNIVINEVRNTEQLVKLAEFLVKEYPFVVGKGTPVDVAIALIRNKSWGIGDEDLFKEQLLKL